MVRDACCIVDRYKNGVWQAICFKIILLIFDTFLLLIFDFLPFGIFDFHILMFNFHIGDYLIFVFSSIPFGIFKVYLIFGLIFDFYRTFILYLIFI